MKKKTEVRLNSEEEMKLRDSEEEGWRQWGAPPCFGRRSSPLGSEERRSRGRNYCDQIDDDDEGEDGEGESDEVESDGDEIEEMVITS